MGANQSRLVIAGLFFLFIFLSGLWLSHSGKPYPAIRFNIHKLIGLAAGVFLGWTVSQIHQASPLGPLEITAVVVTALIFAATVIAGGLISIDKPMPVAISKLHKVFLYMTILSTAVTLYLLQ